MYKKLLLFLIVFSSFSSFAQTGYFAPTDYDKAVWMATRFYGGNRSTDVNHKNSSGEIEQTNWLIQDYLPSGVPSNLEGLSFTQDSEGTHDLSGGWFDCGDHVFFGQTGFFSGYALLKMYDVNPEGYDDLYSHNYEGYRNSGDYTWSGGKGTPNGIPDILDEVKHQTDFFIKCARNSTTFYYQKGDGAADHAERITSVKMQTNPVNTGGEPRQVLKNPNGAAMASFCSATLALMSRVYEKFDPVYAALCLQHAEYAYDYASSKTGSQSSPGFYGGTNNWRNAWAICLSEMWLATGETSYRTAAFNLTTSTDNSGDVRPNGTSPFDYENYGDLSLYVLASINHPTAGGHFNTRIQDEYLNNTNYNGEGVYKKNWNWGIMRYVANAAYIISLYDHYNGNSLSQKVYDNLDYIMGHNSGNQSYIVGFAPEGSTVINIPTQAHHRNAYLYEGNDNDYNGPLPTKNEQLGSIVGGALDGTYNASWNDYVNTEVCVDYNSPFTGALAAVKSELNPIDPDKFLCDAEKPEINGGAAELSLCGVGTITLNSGLSAASNRQFTWTDGSTTVGPSSSLNTYDVSSAGTWEVVVDTLIGGNIECSTSDNIDVSDVLGTVDLGDDFVLCNPTDSILDAGIAGSGLDYMWSDGSTSQTLYVSEAGTYGVTVSASGCASEMDEIEITSLAPETFNDTICEAGSVTLSVTDNGGSYVWYDDDEATNQVGTGLSYTTTIASTTPFYVKDVSAFETYAGPTSITGTSQHDPNVVTVKFTAYSDFTLESVKILAWGYNTSTQTWTPEIYDGSLNYNDINNATPLHVGTTSTNAAISNEETEREIPVGIAITGDAAGTPYWFRFQSASDSPIRYSDNSFSASPYQALNGGDVIMSIDYANVHSSQQNNGGWVYDWKIAAGTDCNAKPVTAVLDPNYDNCDEEPIGVDCSSRIEEVSSASVTDAVESCEEGEWTHYYETGNTTNILFSIKKGSNNFSCDVDINVTSLIEETDGNATGAFVMGRNWNVDVNTGSNQYNNPVSVRFYFDPIDMQDLIDAADAFAATNSDIILSDVQWFKTIGGVDFDASTMVTQDGLDLNNTIVLNDVSNVTELNSDVHFVQIDGVSSFSGGTAFIQTINVPLDIEEEFDFSFDSQSESISVFPNPSSDVFSLKFENTLANKYTIQVVNSLGSVVEVVDPSSGGTLTFGSDLSSGVYRVLISDGKETITKSIVKL